jgi:hypothetical protein
VPLLILALLLLIILAFGGVVLLSLTLRYRAGTARRRARRWIAALNIWLTSLSAIFFFFFALLISFWVRDAVKIALIGMIAGGACGLLGLALTRWDREDEAIFYTPNRWLALLITAAIAGRFVYGWWRAFHPVAASGNQSWLMAASGKQISLAIGGGLICYYLVYSIGLRQRLSRHEIVAD